jgi:hypothetical protein
MKFDYGKYNPAPAKRKTGKSAFLRKLEKAQRKEIESRATVTELKQRKKA